MLHSIDAKARATSSWCYYLARLRVRIVEACPHAALANMLSPLLTYVDIVSMQESYLCDRTSKLLLLGPMTMHLIIQALQLLPVYNCCQVGAVDYALEGV